MSAVLGVDLARQNHVQNLDSHLRFAASPTAGLQSLLQTIQMLSQQALPRDVISHLAAMFQFYLNQLSGTELPPNLRRGLRLPEFNADQAARLEQCILDWFGYHAACLAQLPVAMDLLIFFHNYNKRPGLNDHIASLLGMIVAGIQLAMRRTGILEGKDHNTTLDQIFHSMTGASRLGNFQFLKRIVFSDCALDFAEPTQIDQALDNHEQMSNTENAADHTDWIDTDIQVLLDTTFKNDPDPELKKIIASILARLAVLNGDQELLMSYLKSRSDQCLLANQSLLAGLVALDEGFDLKPYLDQLIPMFICNRPGLEMNRFPLLQKFTIQSLVNARAVQRILMDQEAHLTRTGEIYQPNLMHLHQLCRQAELNPPLSLDEWSKMAEKARDAGDARQARQAYQSVLYLDPDVYDARLNLGLLLSEADELKEARVQFEKARQLQPQLSESYVQLGNLFRKSGQYQPALSMLQNAVELNENSGAIWFNLGLLYKEQTQFKQSEECFIRAYLLGGQPPSDANLQFSAAYQLACVRALLDYPESALRLLDECLQGFAFIGTGQREKYRQIARSDSDFASLNQDPQFLNLLK